MVIFLTQRLEDEVEVWKLYNSQLKHSILQKIEYFRTATDDVKLDHNYARYCSICCSPGQMHCTEKSYSKGGGLIYGNLSSLHINTLWICYFL